VRVETSAVIATFSRAQSFALTSLLWKNPAGGTPELLAGPANDLVTFNDYGSLYTFASESGACGWGEASRTSTQDPTAASVSIARDGDLRVSVVVTSATSNGNATRTARFTNGGAIEFETQVTPAPGTSISARFPLALGFDAATMDAPFGIATRTSIRDAHQPTFHPVGEWIDFTDRALPLGVSLAAPANPAVSFTTTGQVDLIVARDVPFNQQCGATGAPGGTIDTSGPVDVRYTLVPHGALSDPSAVYALVADQNRPLAASLVASGGSAPRVRSLASVDAPTVFVSSIAPAADGNGWMVRLYRPGNVAIATKLTVDLGNIASATLVDASGAALTASPVDAVALSAPTLVDPHTVSINLLRPVETLLLRPAAQAARAP